MNLDFNPPCKSETLQRNLRGEAVTKHLSLVGEYFVANYRSLKLSGQLNGEKRQKASGQIC